MPHYEVELPASLSDPDGWFLVRGGDLDHEVAVKVRLHGPDRPVVYAVRVDDRTEVTSRHLRSLRLPLIARAVLDEVRSLAQGFPMISADDFARLPTSQGMHDLRGDPSPMAELAWEGAIALEIEQWLAEVADATSDLEERPRGRGARPPSDEDYRAFARVYLEELLVDASGVATRTAKRLHMTRPTAYRWLDICRERGLIPPREEIS